MIYTLQEKISHRVDWTKYQLSLIKNISFVKCAKLDEKLFDLISDILYLGSKLTSLV